MEEGRTKCQEDPRSLAYGLSSAVERNRTPNFVRVPFPNPTKLNPLDCVRLGSATKPNPLDCVQLQNKFA